MKKEQIFIKNEPQNENSTNFLQNNASFIENSQNHLKNENSTNYMQNNANFIENSQSSFAINSDLNRHFHFNIMQSFQNLQALALRQNYFYFMRPQTTLMSAPYFYQN